MVRVFILALITVLVGQTAIAEKKHKLGKVEIPSLLVEIDSSDRHFTVINSRMDETATAAVFFGLIGAAVNSGINSSEDRALADVFRDTADKIELAALIEAKLIATLEKADAINLVTDEQPDSQILKLEIKDWGLVRVSNSDQNMRVFLNVRVTMKNGKTTHWDTRRHEAGKKEVLFINFTDELLTSETTKLANKVGRRIAYEIIYR